MHYIIFFLPSENYFHFALLMEHFTAQYLYVDIVLLLMPLYELELNKLTTVFFLGNFKCFYRNMG